MNDTFSADAWKKISQLKQRSNQNDEPCFSNLTRKQIMLKQVRNTGECEENMGESKTELYGGKVLNQAQSRQIDVAKKVRKSYEQLAYKER